MEGPDCHSRLRNGRRWPDFQHRTDDTQHTRSAVPSPAKLWLLSQTTDADVFLVVRLFDPVNTFTMRNTLHFAAGHEPYMLLPVIPGKQPHYRDVRTVQDFSFGQPDISCIVLRDDI